MFENILTNVFGRLKCKSKLSIKSKNKTRQSCPRTSYPPLNAQSKAPDSPLDSVPFEITTLVDMDKIFLDLKETAIAIENAEQYSKSKESDYDFNVEQGVFYK